MGVVVIGSGDKLPITKIGKLEFKINSIFFKKVLYVPQIFKKRVTTTELYSYLNCFIMFTQKNFHVKDMRSQEILFSGINKRGVYYFAPEISCNLGIKTGYDEWHRRLGHTSLKIMAKIGNVIEIKNSDRKQLSFYNNFPMSKMCKLPFKYCEIRTKKC